MNKLVVPSIAAFLILLMAGWLGTRGNGTKRYVSPLLADGSRYTFLYAQSMNLQPSDGANCFLQEGEQQIGAVARLRALLPGRRNKSGLLIGTSRDEIRVQFAQQKPPYANSRDNVVGRRSQYLTVRDARSRSLFWIEHHCYGSDSSTCQGESALLSQSFRVLPPGKYVPR